MFVTHIAMRLFALVWRFQLLNNIDDAGITFDSWRDLPHWCSSYCSLQNFAGLLTEPWKIRLLKTLKRKDSQSRLLLPLHSRQVGTGWNVQEHVRQGEHRIEQLREQAVQAFRSTELFFLFFKPLCRVCFSFIFQVASLQGQIAESPEGLEKARICSTGWTILSLWCPCF